MSIRSHFAAIAAVTAALLVSVLLLGCSSDGQAEPSVAQQAEQSGQSEQAQPQSSATTQSQQDQQQPVEAGDAEQEQQDDQAQTTVSRSNPSAQSQDKQQQSTQSGKQDSAEQSNQKQDAASDDQEADAEQSEDQEAEQGQSQQSDSQPEQSSDDSSAERQSQEPRQLTALEIRAEEIRAQATAPDLTGLNGWLNGEPTSIALEIAKGNVVLVDFWTYTCINCVRTLPFLTAWDEKYREHGLVILGVHTPEFEFEKLPANISAAIDEYGIRYDVPIDNDYRTWRAYRNRYWPAKYLVGPTADSPMGIRYFHFGEGHYHETELEIRAALEAAGRDLSDVPVGVEVATPVKSRPVGQTRELYAGWRRNVGRYGPYNGQDAYFLSGSDKPNIGVPILFEDVDPEDREHDLWYVHGLWRIENEYIVHARETEDLEDYLALLVWARTANVVLTVADDGQPYDVFVQYDGDWLTRDIAGEHIQWDGQGRSFVRVTENDLYRLLFFPEFSQGELILRSNSDQFRVFAFTFGSYVGGE